MIAFVNGHFLPEEQASIGVGDLSVQRGYAAFDFFRIRNNKPLFLDDYLSRFFNSIATMHLQPAQTKEELKEIIYALVEKNKIENSGMRMILTGGYSPDSYQPVQPNLIVTQHVLNLPSAEKFDTGIKVITKEYQRDLPTVKSINYLMGIWLQEEVNARQAEDVLYYRNGIVSEFPRANVFMVTRDNTVVTPSEHVLRGITRKRLLEWMSKDFKMEERNIGIDEIRDAAEVFMTSTTKRLLAINQIDDTVIGDGKAGPVTRKLSDTFIRLENQVLGL
ncbi:MAG TPA: aminotransferase class IV [Flavitalea sp.]|nr:aminotransferase class IV [Flavitalea sp.]